jgi:hypothetical protein
MPNFPNRCQHLKVNGTQCGSPALRRNRFCYFHKLHHEERIELNLDRLKSARRRRATIDLPVLEDANSIQVTLMQIMRLIVAGQIDGKTAGLLLYALQTASSNLPRTSFAPDVNDVVLDLKTVHETPLSGHIWEEEDFRNDEDDEVTMRAEALEEARQRATKKAELDRWAEAEADRLTAEGNRQRAAARQADRQQQAEQEELAEPASSKSASPAQPARKRPNANVSLDEVRKQVSAQIRKALPAIAAAQSAGENGKRGG